MTAVGFDDAIIGYVEIYNNPPLALYNKTKCLEILMEQHNMTDEEAIEYFENNISCAYVGEYTPAFATLFDDTYIE